MMSVANLPRHHVCKLKKTALHLPDPKKIQDIVFGLPMFILVQNSWGNRSNISASANQQKYHCEQTLKVKDGRLYCGNRIH